MRALGPQWPDLIANFVGKDGGGLIFMPGELFSQQLFEADDPDSAGGKWTRILPVVREAGLFKTEAEVRLGTQSTYVLELTPEGRGDPIFEFHPDPIRNRSVLASLPGMYWNFPVTRARPGATVLARHGDAADAEPVRPPGPPGLAALRPGPDRVHRLRQHLPLALPVRGLLRRLLGPPGRPGRAEQGPRGAVPVPGQPGPKSSFRVGDRVAIGVRYTEAAAVAEASELAAEVELEGQPAEPLRFERSRRRPLEPSRPRSPPRRRGRTRSGSPRRPASTPGPRPGSRRPPSASSRRGARSTSPRSTGPCSPTSPG